MSVDSSLRDHFEGGLESPLCLTWELTYACNLACRLCLSSSGRRDPRELSTDEALRLIDELAAMQVFYVNVGGGEPMIRRDFFDIIEHAVARRVGVKFSTNGTRVDEVAAPEAPAKTKAARTASAARHARRAPRARTPAFAALTPRRRWNPTSPWHHLRFG